MDWVYADGMFAKPELGTIVLFGWASDGVWPGRLNPNQQLF
jgi:hypothetical protein